MTLADVWSERETRRMLGSVANDANRCAAEHTEGGLVGVNTSVLAQNNQNSIAMIKCQVA